MTGTLTVSDPDDAGADNSALAAYLFRVFQCDRPTAAPSRHALDALDEVLVARTAADDAARRDRTLELGVRDDRLSSRHARLVREVEHWVLEDSGSKNGSFVNGARIERQLLCDGDVIELGHTLWRYRELAPSSGAADATAVAAVPGLATLIPSFTRELEALASVVRSELAIIIQGETGTGKEVVARAIHELSERRGPWVPLNCAALPPTLVVAELFGTRRGAFSGADEDRPGIVRASDHGTLFLDEIADASDALQLALLRVAQEREVLPVGATRPVPVDLRLLAATQRDLGSEAEHGRFRRDLYARLAGFRLRLPPLRERIEDLGLIIAALLPRVAGTEPVRFGRSAAHALLRYAWPLNIRELEQALAGAALQAHGTIELAHLPEAVQRGAAAAPAPPSTSAPSRDELIALLEEHDGNVSAIARALGKARVQIQRWLKHYGLSAAEHR